MDPMAEVYQLDAANSPDNDLNNTKRKRDESGPPTQQRAKRNRYISIACNECKRRKIKCNGETPCQRCGNLNLECLYAPNCCGNNFRDSNEYKAMNAHIQSLQEQVDNLLNNVASLRRAIGQDLPASDDIFGHEQSLQRHLGAPQASMTAGAVASSQDPHAGYKNSANPSYAFDVSHSNLRSMGISAGEQEVDGNSVHRADMSNENVNIDPLLHSSKDPIWNVGKDEALRLFRIYEEEVGVMYPLLEIEAVQRHATHFFAFADAAFRTGLARPSGADGMYDEDMDILKLVLAIALLCNASVESQMASRLFESVCKSTESRFLGNVNLKGIRILTLTAIYHFHSNNEALSWRVIGLTARLCIELGLHRQETYDTLFANNDQERESAIKLFWVVYVLDRRWSFGTGLSFAFQAADIDSSLPKPTESSPYLTAMIDLSHIGTKVWNTMPHGESTSEKAFSNEDVKYLDYQITQWYQSLPESLRYHHPFSSEEGQAHNQQSPEVIAAAVAANEVDGRAMYRLRILLCLRRNQMRTVVYRPGLGKPSSLSSSLAQVVVDVAKDTIRVLSHINKTSDIYKTGQMCFNYFLLNAIEVLFQAVLRLPAKFADVCRREFGMALDLVRELSADSYVSRRLWENLKGLKEVAPRMGLLERNGEASSDKKAVIPAGAQTARRAHSVQQQVQHDAHSSAAMAMAGLAGHPVDESVFYANQPLQSSRISASMPMSLAMYGQAPRNAALGETASVTSNFNGIANELMSLYDAAGGQVGNTASEANYSAMTDASSWADGMGGVGGTTWGTEEDMSRVMRNLF